ncbi:RodZ domain-containing protein [Nitrincola sp.]|uniref:RodZ domain-containing protein n=1 Tax=Nitrincola sp. TaxID=1926584 RepID=UPI003A90F840
MSSDQTENQQSGFPGHEFVVAREARNLSLQQVSAELNLPIKVLDAIESGSPQSFHNPVFLRGYIRTYAKHLKLDPDYYANVYANLPGVDLKPTEIRSTTSVQERDPSRSPFMKLFTWLFVLAIIAVIVWWSREQYGLTPPSTPSPDVSEPAPDVFDPPVAAVSPIIAAPERDSLVDADSDGADVLSVEPEVSELIPDEAEAQEDDVVSVDVPEEAAALSSTQGLYIRFSDDCWIQIRDATDSLIYSGVAQGGSELQLEGDEPLSLVIGRRDAVDELLFNGDVISLSSFTSGNVARFSLPLN